MKKLASLLVVSVLAGVLTLAGYFAFFEKEIYFVDERPELPSYTPATYAPQMNSSDVDFTEAARKTVGAVVHVKNIAVRRSPFSNATGRALQGAGSGVIISPDGYIITNNHVIQRANRLQVTLNNNQNYMAEVIGTDPQSDIALLKIDAEDLEYLTFGNSDNTQVGEWVLAVGNPFNLTSTVTAGIISAKSRDLGMGSNPSSFIQTDAAINPGNSGGALVNTLGELIGINTAITSQTGSYVGYAFAVPSNNARKIVEDIMEFGDVQRGILGIRGRQAALEDEVAATEGIYVSDIEEGTGADRAGIREGDVITQIDNIRIRNWSDLTGYLNAKRPNDVVSVNVLRNGRERNLDVRLSKSDTYQIAPVGLEVSNATPTDLRRSNTENGVKITRGLTPQMQSQQLEGTIISAIDNQDVENIEDVRRIMNNRNMEEPISITFVAPNGEKQRYVFRR